MKNKLRLFLVAALSLFLSCLAAPALAFRVDGIRYSVESEEEFTCGVASNDITGDVVIPESVTYGDKTYSVTKIYSSAFKGCTGLTSIVIPSSVTSIGDFAFYKCTGITSVTLEDGSSILKMGHNGNYGGLFSDCPLTSVYWGRDLSYAFAPLYKSSRKSKLTKVIIGDSVTSIGASAFSGCTGLTSVSIPNSVTSIGASAFSGCTGLTSAAIPNSVTSIGRSAFGGCTGLTSAAIPNSVTSIDAGAFSGCTGLTSVSIPNSVTSIDAGAFSGCTGLTSVSIPNSVTSIGGSAFYGCTGLTSVSIPNSVTSIGGYAFGGCDALANFTIPNSVTYIGTFEVDNVKFVMSDDTCRVVGCYGKNVVIPETVTYGGRTFPVTSIGERAFEGSTGLTSVTIPSSVTSIGEGAFEGCTGLTSVTIEDGSSTLTVDKGWGSGEGMFSDCPLTSVYIGRNFSCKYGYPPFRDQKKLTELTISSSVTSIDAGAFSYCSSLTSITIPNTVASIGDYAFSGCTGLTSIEIPNSVSAIGENAFTGCTGLTSVTIPNSVTTIGGEAFRDCSSLTSVTIEDGESTLSIYGSSSKTLFYGCDLARVHLGRNLSCGASFTPFRNSGLTELTIGDSVTEICNYAFDGCGVLTNVTIPYSVARIGSYAFAHCSSLADLTIPGTVKHIGTFEVDNVEFVMSDDTCRVVGCYGKNVVIPETVTYGGRTFPVTSIGDDAFRGRSNLTSVTIPSSVTSIGDFAFYKCTGITSVTLEDGSSILKMGHNGNYGGLFSDCPLTSVYLGRDLSYSFPSAPFSHISELTEVTIGDSVTTLGDYAFSHCTGLTSVAVPNSVTTIDGWAFSYCTGLTSVSFGDSVASIGYSAFDGCTELMSVTIPKSVKLIGAYAFSDCTGLTNLVCLAATPPTADESTFSTSTYSKAVLSVPTGTADEYASAVCWKNFFDASDAVKNITIDRQTESTIFDLQGRKLTKPQRGLNIINGRKALVK